LRDQLLDIPIGRICFRDCFGVHGQRAGWVDARDRFRNR
jgi:hypothetical protein